MDKNNLESYNEFTMDIMNFVVLCFFSSTLQHIDTYATFISLIVILLIYRTINSKEPTHERLIGLGGILFIVGVVVNFGILNENATIYQVFTNDYWRGFFSELLTEPLGAILFYVYFFAFFLSKRRHAEYLRTILTTKG